MKHKVFNLIVLFAAIVLSNNAIAYDFTDTLPDGQVLYFDTLNGEAHIVRPGYYSSFDNYVTGDLVIPSTVTHNGVSYTVTSLKELVVHGDFGTSYYGTFQGCSGLTSVTIPSTITRIDSKAFYNCTGITDTLIIPSTVQSIGSSAFYNVPVVQYYGDNVYLWPWGAQQMVSFTEDSLVFSNPDKTVLIGHVNGITSAVIPNSVLIIGYKAFHNCTTLTSASIPSSVTSIGSSSFYNCSNLASINIPDSVRSIGWGAFYHCYSLFSLVIPNGVESIESGAFSGITFVEYHGAASGSPWGATYYNKVVDNGFVFDDETRTLLLLYYGNQSEVTVPTSVTSIANEAFMDNTNIHSIVVSDSVLSIGNNVFQGCSELNSVTIGRSVISIGSGVFDNCPNLEVIIINADSCEDLSKTINYNRTSIFANCGNLNTVIIGNTVKYLPQRAFKDCTGITNLVFNADSCVITGTSSNTAFSGCTNINTATIGNNVKYIPSNLFYGFGGLTSITIGSGVKEIGNNAFYNCFYLSNVNYSGSIDQWCRIKFNNYNANPTNFSHGFFIQDTLVTNLVIPEGITKINDYAFYNCSLLSSITFPAELNNIGTSAFSGCTGLTKLTLPEGVSTIGPTAFRNCTGLTEIISLSSVAPLLSDNVFINVPTTIAVHIPCGSLMSYYSRWSYFSGFVEAEGFSFSAQSAVDSMGMVDVLVTPTCQSPQAMFYASANDGYVFLNWSDSSTDNPRVITLTSDTSITAYFSTISLDTVFVHDTTFVDVPYDVHDTLYVHDTSFVDILIHDTTFVDVPYDVHDTLYVHDTSFVDVFIYDTTYVYDTTYIESLVHDTLTITLTDTLLITHYDTVTLYDTIYDTIYISEQGIDGAEALNVKVYASHGKIVVEGAEGYNTELYDIMGRLAAHADASHPSPLTFHITPGTYLVKIGGFPARKVVAIRK